MKGVVKIHSRGPPSQRSSNPGEGSGKVWIRTALSDSTLGVLEEKSTSRPKGEKGRGGPSKFDRQQRENPMKAFATDRRKALKLNSQN